MEINKNDIVSFKVEDIQEFSDGTKAYKLGDFYVSEDILNKMKATSVGSFASTECASTDAINTYNPFNRAGRGGEYWYIDIDGEVKSFQEDGEPADEELRDVANYCTDKKLIEQRAMHEVLNRLLWRYSEEHGGDKEWDTTYPFNKHWYVYFTYTNNKFDCTYNDSHKKIGNVYFNSEEVAQNAIKDIVEPFIEKHPDFVW